MGRFTNLSKIKEQAELIETLADRVNGDIGTQRYNDLCSYGERKDGAN